MLNFKEWIKENFRSAIPLRVTIKKVINKEIDMYIFYEKVHDLNLKSYLGSFNVRLAKDFFVAPSYLRSLVYYTNDGFLVFVFGGSILHSDVAKYLSSGKMKIPDIDYEGIYNKAYRKNEVDLNNWVLPCYIENNKIGMYLDAEYVNNLPTTIKTDLGFNDKEWIDFLKNIGKA